jgi:hypothetical protein
MSPQDPHGAFGAVNQICSFVLLRLSLPGLTRQSIVPLMDFLDRRLKAGDDS